MHGYEERSAAAAKFIRDYTVVHGYPPSVREITEHVGYASLNSTHGMLARMVREGLITKGPASVARSIRVVDVVTPDAPRDKRKEL